ncbi:hypothetical protein GPJ56_003830 [Histomonas meleagridis]|uniref:uncharacterized protein n=1 Tax=Histomonas meleagridis TaxID=135588 RepID=UPI003559DF2D|nr:hypothetical protein GPJ56_003830 [Histomonas meleagridis]KAH0805288.1 hypothetical protein GO595_002233 [Histomonas meleagridis]
MTDLIFNNNIIAIAIQNFPSSYSFGIFINLSLSSPIYREALIQAGIFQQLFSILNDPMSLYHIQAIHLSDSLLYKLEDFDYSNFIDAYISLFQILFSKINTSDALLLHQLLRFIRDFIEADQRFLLYFVNNNFYPQILSLDVTDTNCIYNIIKISDNICYYFNEGIPFLIQHNIIEYLSNTLLNSDQRIVEVSFYLLSQMIFEDNSIADLCVESSFQRIAIAKFNGESKHHLKQAAYEFLCQLMLNTTENYYVELNGDRCIYVLLSYIYLCEEENRSDMCAVIDRFLKTRAEDEIQLVMSEMEGEDDFIEWLERGAEGNDEDVAALSESLLQKLYEDPEYDDE